MLRGIVLAPEVRQMNRTELDITLSRDRAWLLETLSNFPPEKLKMPVSTMVAPRCGRTRTTSSISP